MKKKVLTVILCALALLLCVGCTQSAGGTPPPDAETEQESDTAAENTGNGGTVSIDPSDYGITDDMLSAPCDFSDFSLEALGAYYLHTDGAMAEGSGDELYQRFMKNPESVFRYMAELGSQKARGDDTAAAELCRNISAAEVFWYDNAEETFTDILREYQSRYPALVELLQAAYDADVRELEESLHAYEAFLQTSQTSGGTE